MTSKTSITRGIRNNNPGNLRRTNDPWQGLAEKQTDKDFFVFKNVTYGIRALARILINYQDKSHLRTIRDIIRRFAPASENNTSAYVESVSKRTGFDINQRLDMHNYDHLFPLIDAIILHENGQQPYADSQLIKGLVLAGVEPPTQDLQKTRTVKGGQAATAATVGMAVVQAVQQTIDPARAALTGLVPYLDFAKWLLLAVTLIGIGTMLWARIDDHLKGLR